MTRRRALRLGALAALVLWPWAGLPSSFVGNADTAAVYLIAAVSLVMLTGWVGQVSLAQASFVGVGAYVAAMAVRSGIGFPLNLVVSAAAAAAAATLLGLVALRVRGLYLAVATLIFAYVTNAYLFTATWMGGTGGSTSADVITLGEPKTFPFVDFSDRRAFYYVVLAAAAAAIFALLNLRDSKVGRAFFAVRGSEIAAASFGIDVIRTKLFAFALSGFVAGLAGALVMSHQGSVIADQFNLTKSLFYLSIAVVGGLASIGGAVAASVVFAAIDELFFRVQALAGYLDLVSAGLLGAVLLLYPGGLAAFGESLRGRLPMWRARLEPHFAPAFARLGDEWMTFRSRLPSPFRRRADDSDDEDDVAEVDVFARFAGRRRVESIELRPRSVEPALPAVLDASGITVQFGGLRAVDMVSLEVRQGEIVGLIGPNGAGKTTLFNAISGLNRPTAGTVAIHGQDATGAAVHRRASMGLARTFQVLQLFPQLDVFDNILVGTHLQSRSNPLAHIVLTRGAIEGERAARENVEAVVDFLGLRPVMHARIRELPFGVLRMVELARALVSDAPLVMLDEPASGLDNAETDRLSDILRRLRGELGVSLLVIEHDVRMVTALCDYLYVIDRGRLIAEGTPLEVQRNEAVIAAYLGTAAHEEAAV